jgi:hypothetical protein
LISLETLHALSEAGGGRWNRDWELSQGETPNADGGGAAKVPFAVATRIGLVSAGFRSYSNFWWRRLAGAQIGATPAMRTADDDGRAQNASNIASRQVICRFRTGFSIAGNAVMWAPGYLPR